MGWVSDREEFPSCEGYVVGIVDAGFPREREGPCSALPRWQSPELWPFREIDARDGQGQIANVNLVRVACTCGWRSRVLRVHKGEYWPSYTEISPEQEDRARVLWKEHLRTQVRDSALLYSDGAFASWSSPR